MTGVLKNGSEFAKGIEGLKGVIIIEGDNIGLWGEVKISRTYTRGKVTSGGF